MQEAKAKREIVGKGSGRVFAEGYKLYCKLKQQRPDIDILSMGMTHDYETAIEEGANMVRIGTALFGQRDYSLKF